MYNKQEIIVSSIFSSEFVQNIVLCIPQSRSKQIHDTNLFFTLKFVSSYYFICKLLEFFVNFLSPPICFLCGVIYTDFHLYTGSNNNIMIQALFTEDRGRSIEKLLNTCFNIPFELQSCCYNQQRDLKI